MFPSVALARPCQAAANVTAAHQVDTPRRFSDLPNAAAEPDGTRTSALRFTTRDRLSPLGEGRGYWRYVPTPAGVRFITGYDYRPGWGRLIDGLGIRRFVGWMTAWSFDRLRIWAETGHPPEKWPLRSALAFWQRGRPRAVRCLRQPVRGQAMDESPATLRTLEAP